VNGLALAIRGERHGAATAVRRLTGTMRLGNPASTVGLMAGYALRGARRLFSRTYAVAWAFLGVYGVFAVVYLLLSLRSQAALIGWASTNVHNLRTDPAGTLIVSAFIPPAIGWAGLIVLALFTASKLLGSIGTALVMGVGHVIGTLVSEGIVAARVASGGLPVSAQFIVDVGPSYVVISALAVTMLYGTWLYAIPAAVSFAAMAGDLFGGLPDLEVPAVGHLTALTAGIVLGGLLLRRARRRLQPVTIGKPPSRPPSSTKITPTPTTEIVRYRCTHRDAAPE
jgi:hypothetical protein